MNLRQVVWTDERVAELREKAKTLTAGEIARGWDVTRNVICGKMARLGITRPDAPIKRPKSPMPTPKIERRRILAPPRTKPAPPLVPQQLPIQVPLRPVDIWHLTSRTCRYPLWHDSEPISEKLYCGGNVVEGLPYCHCHAKITYPGRAT
jgi:hypothetical protein